MRITFYGYNTFIIEDENSVIAIDPGASLYLPDFFRTVIPKNKWPDITHILVTHGDPDHYWHADRVAESSEAFLVLNEVMIKGDKMIGPRKKDFGLIKKLKRVEGLNPNEKKIIGGIAVTGVYTEHGSLLVKIGPFKKTLTPGPSERIGYGALGYHVVLNNKTFMNLGDTLMKLDEWQDIEAPDVLMIPIGGGLPGNTMNEDEALKAVELLKPKVVIPCHYNCPGFLKKCYNPADDVLFKQGVEALGSKCYVMKPGDTRTIEF